jgi:hypothetical protein
LRKGSFESFDNPGLTVGRGSTLDLGGHRLRVRWHADLDDRATVQVALDKDSRRTDRSGVLNIEGNAELAGTLKIEVKEDLQPGVYGICAVNGIRKGTFTRIDASGDYSAAWQGSVLCLSVPKP